MYALVSYYLSPAFMSEFKKMIRALLTGSFLIFMFCTTVTAQTTATTTAACSSTARTAIQLAVNRAVAGVPTTINVTGSCIDNVKVPKGKFVSIVAGTGATLAPANASLPALEINGQAAVSKLAISAPSSSGRGVINVWGGGQLYLFGSSVIVSANTKHVLNIQQSSFANITNSRIRGYTTGTSASAILVQTGSQVEIYGDPSNVQGPDGFGTTIQMDTVNTSASSPKAAGIDGINCGNNSGVKIDTISRTANNVTTAGTVRISFNGTGIRSNQCNVSLFNGTTSASSIIISDNSNSGLFAYDGNYQINGVTIRDNGTPTRGWGVNMITSPAVITSSVFSGNYQDILADRGSVVVIDKWDTHNWKTSFANLSDSSIFCGRNGYVVYGADAVQQTPFPPEGSDPCILAE